MAANQADTALRCHSVHHQSVAVALVDAGGTDMRVELGHLGGHVLPDDEVRRDRVPGGVA